MLSILSPVSAVVLSAGVGAIIDFLIGPTGQKKLRDKLEDWWIRFDDVRLENFGRKEAEYAAYVIDRMFGRRLFGWKRWIVSFSIILFFVAFGYFYMVWYVQMLLPIRQSFMIGIPGLAVGLVGLALSLSATRIIATVVIQLSNDGIWRNLIVFTLFFIATIALISLWLPIVRTFSFIFTVTLEYLIGPVSIDMVIRKSIDVSHQQMTELIRRYGSLSFDTPDSLIYRFSFLTNRQEMLEWQHLFPSIFALSFSAFFSPVLRLVIALVFLLSFMFRPLVRAPISLLWRRLIEIEKPIFTVAFGIVATIFQALKALADGGGTAAS